MGKSTFGKKFWHNASKIFFAKFHRVLHPESFRCTNEGSEPEKNIWCRCVINFTKTTKNDNWMFKNIPGDWTRHLRVRDALVSHDFMNGTTLKPPLLVKVFSWLHTISWLYACSLSLLSGTHLTLVVGRHNGKVHCTRTYSNPTNVITYQSTFGIFDIPSLVWHTFISVTYLHNCDIPS